MTAEEGDGVSDVAIRVEGLGKRYRIGQRERYHALRDVLARSAARLLRRGDGRPDPESGWIWALKDVSFEVKEGEVLGIIGRNGAGKTTLLKILARITKPTEGYAEVRGRVGSLLEVGTGFHPELTGRENVYLSGAVLGMTRREIDRKFDEIVDFAGVERFIDTPLKYYSAGMQTRLAFAVAAHLDPEVLLVDEVLAVGDLEFQRKCLGKMEEVGGSGRTVVFVSHQMNQIRRLCQRVMWLDAGRMVRDGPTTEVTAAYEAAVLRGGAWGDGGRDITPSVKARFLSWETKGAQEGPGHTLGDLGPATVVFRVWARSDLGPCHHGILLLDAEGRLVWGWGVDGIQLAAGMNELVYEFSMLPVRPGPYFWYVTIFGDGGVLDKWEATPPLVVSTVDYQHMFDQWQGVLNVPFRFAIRNGQEAKASGRGGH
jgi:ABC-type polysaccharide/polyol phosphate transport system ATPase subunit